MPGIVLCVLFAIKALSVLGIHRHAFLATSSRPAVQKIVFQNGVVYAILTALLFVLSALVSNMSGIEPECQPFLALTFVALSVVFPAMTVSWVRRHKLAYC